MSWHGILGHDDVVERFRRALLRGRLASSFLFVGPRGIGKRTFALKLAQALLCQARGEAAMDPCGQCEACVQVGAGTHPDLEVVAKPADKSFIPLALLIGDEEHRMQEGLVHDLGLRPFMGGRKIAVIDDADFLNAEGANCLLKTLEEPPPRSVLILIGTSPARQLPTIRSRCQLIRFRPLDQATVAQLLVSQGLVDDPQQAQRLAQASEGSLEQALEMADAALWAFRGTFYQRLAGGLTELTDCMKAVSALVDEAGREAPARRRRLRQIVALATDFYRWLLLALGGRSLCDDAEARPWIARAAETWSGGVDRAAACLDCCLEAAEQIDRNANQSTLIECWLDGLASGGQ